MSSLDRQPKLASRYLELLPLRLPVDILGGTRSIEYGKKEQSCSILGTVYISFSM